MNEKSTCFNLERVSYVYILYIYVVYFYLRHACRGYGLNMKKKSVRHQEKTEIY